MSPAILQTLFMQIVIPEIGQWLATRRAASMPPPTKEELLAEMTARAEVVIAAGTEWLRSKGVTA